MLYYIYSCPTVTNSMPSLKSTPTVLCLHHPHVTQRRYESQLSKNFWDQFVKMLEHHINEMTIKNSMDGQDFSTTTYLVCSFLDDYYLNLHFSFIKKENIINAIPPSWYHAAT